MAALAGLVLASCSKTEDSAVECIPFLETDDGQWGMISMDGKVLFKEEFKNKPTVVRDGRFFVRNNSGYWEMYDASEKPKKIGADYAHVSGFYNGRALVAAKNQPVSIIDTEGKEIKCLDKIGGKEVDGVRAFCEGYAVFMTTDSLLGAIDTDGNCVVKPEYCLLNDCGDGKFIGVYKKYKKDIDAGRIDKVKVSVINTSGEVLFDFRKDKYESCRDQFVDGKLAVSIMKGGKKTWGIINDKGDFVVNPSAKLKEIGNIGGDVFTYNNGEGWGLMNIDGEILIRAKYEYLYIEEDNLLVAAVSDGGSYEFKYVGQNDNQVGEDTYVYVLPFCLFDDEHALVKPNDKLYSIIDRSGNQLEGLPDIADIGIDAGESYVKSDCEKPDEKPMGTENGMESSNWVTVPEIETPAEDKELIAQQKAQEAKAKMGEFKFPDNDETSANNKNDQKLGAEEDDKVFTYVEQMPVFPGGEAALLRYLRGHFKYPQVSLEDGVQGTIKVRFVVKENGSVGEVQVLKGLDSYCDKEAKRVISSLPRFTPGRQQGKPVKVWYQIPVRLAIE